MYKIKLTDPFGNVGTIVPVVASILILGFSFLVVGVGSAEASDIQATPLSRSRPFRVIRTGQARSAMILTCTTQSLLLR